VTHFKYIVHIFKPKLSLTNNLAFKIKPCTVHFVSYLISKTKHYYASKIE
jgi:hypothetical protein